LKKRIPKRLSHGFPGIEKLLVKEALHSWPNPL